MNRRSFTKLLTGLPFLGFLGTAKTNPINPQNLPVVQFDKTGIYVLNADELFFGIPVVLHEHSSNNGYNDVLERKALVYVHEQNLCRSAFGIFWGEVEFRHFQYKKTNIKHFTLRMTKNSFSKLNEAVFLSVFLPEQKNSAIGDLVNNAGATLNVRQSRQVAVSQGNI